MKEFEASLFADCTQLQKILIPSWIETISSSVFSKCDNLKEVLFERNSALKQMDSGAFTDCPNIEILELPDSFHNYSSFFINFTRYDLVSNTISIKKLVLSPTYFIMNNYYIEFTFIKFNILSIEAGEETVIEFIENGAFSNKQELTQINFNCKINKIADNAFAYCKNLENVFIKELQSITPYAFASCTSLKEITIQEFDGTIPSGCFYSCQNLVHFNSNCLIQRVGIDAFNSCENLDIDTKEIIFVDESAFSSSRILSFPPKIKHIGENAFFKCVIEQKDIILSNELEYIGNDSFYSLKNKTHSVYYCGDKNFSQNFNVFGDFVINIFVPSNYNYSTFCNRDVIKSESLKCFIPPMTDSISYSHSIKFISKNRSLRRYR